MYTLLTGATGMLGRYLMRDLLLHGAPIAVLVRLTRRESALERVESAMAYWESVWNRQLPRPVVLTGDITLPHLGLSASDEAWVSANCSAILHSAASLTFYEEDDEPWLSNVQGVRNVLELCRELQIRRLYHVSTAYTCGLRDGTVREDELDVGQEYGNDYERSKSQAEALIHAATWLDVTAIFRPSIIVGDSETGYSPTFHGFYTPLRLMCALLSQYSHEEIYRNDFMKLMGLSGSEGKNFVPVDWVSQAITCILERAPEQSRTYTLASSSPVLSKQVFDVIERVTGGGEPQTDSPPLPLTSPTELSTSDHVISAYLEQLKTYRSYWRDDPRFDCANTNKVLPDLPCPHVSNDTLQMLAEWAVNAKFSVPFSKKQPDLPLRWFAVDRGQQPSLRDVSPNHARVLTILGQGGGSWTLEPNASAQPTIREGRLSGADELCVSSETFQNLVSQTVDLRAAATSGDLFVTGECSLESWQQFLHPVLQQCAAQSSQAAT